MQFVVPYRDGTQARRYWPDYIVRVDDGQDDPPNVISEIKGFRGLDAQLKAQTMRQNCRHPPSTAVLIAADWRGAQAA